MTLAKGNDMATVRDPRQLLKEARQIAADHGCIVSEKGGKYLVYRKTPTHQVYLGSRGTPAALRAFVCTVTNFR